MFCDTVFFGVFQESPAGESRRFGTKFRIVTTFLSSFITYKYTPSTTPGLLLYFHPNYLLPSAHTRESQPGVPR